MNSAAISLHRRRDRYLVCTLDGRLSIDLRAGLPLGALQDWLSASRPRCVAIAAPCTLGSGLMADPVTRERYGFEPHSTAWSKWRLAEAELRRRNVRLARTPALGEGVPMWITRAMKLREILQELGYSNSAPPVESRHWLEVIPEAAFAALLKRNPLPRRDLSGRLQRQLVLFLEGVDLQNPMETLEEITRFHLLEGNVSLKGLHNAAELDALCGAYCAHLSCERPSEIVRVGDPREGVSTLPVPYLQDDYPG